jgi:hypothetical protein
MTIARPTRWEIFGSDDSIRQAEFAVGQAVGQALGGGLRACFQGPTAGFSGRRSDPYIRSQPNRTGNAFGRENNTCEETPEFAKLLKILLLPESRLDIQYRRARGSARILNRWPFCAVSADPEYPCFGVAQC